MIHYYFQFHLQNTTSFSNSTPFLQSANAWSYYYSSLELIASYHSQQYHPSITITIDSITPVITNI